MTTARYEPADEIYKFIEVVRISSWLCNVLDDPQFREKFNAFVERFHEEVGLAMDEATTTPKKRKAGTPNKLTAKKQRLIVPSFWG